MLKKNFLDLGSGTETENTSLYMSAVYRAYVLEEENIKKVVKKNQHSSHS